MKILAIDCTGIVSSCAIVEEEKTICEFTINNKLTHAETILPMVSESIEMSEVSLNEIDYVACASGPGSFTGLRIGAATAKSIAHGINKKVIPVPTLDCLAYNIFNHNHIIVPIMDAKKNQVYTAFYKFEKNNLKKISSYMAAEIENVLRELEKYDNVIFLGDGVNVYKDKILEFKDNFIFAPVNNNTQRASSVGALALKNIDSAIPYEEFVPFYIRLSQAEQDFLRNNKNE